MGSASAAIAADSLVISGRWPARRLEAVVWDGRGVAHFRRRLDRPDRPWERVATLAEEAVAPASLVVARSLSASALRARVVHVDGVRIYRFDGGTWCLDADQSWPEESPVLPDAAELGAVDAGGEDAIWALAPAAGGWRQALVEVDGSLYGYHRDPARGWRRASCLRVASGEFRRAENSSVKQAQVTGERDATATPWGERVPTLSRSLSSAGIRGTDLGVRVGLGGRSFLLFGDTHWTRPWWVLRDAIAEVIEDGELPRVGFHGSPLQLRGHGVTQGEYDVPLDAFEHAGAVFAIFSSNHGRQRQVMGRSVLGRLRDRELVIDPAARRRPIRFETLATLSERHFINVSVQRRPAAEVPGCAPGGDVLLLWGTGSYRSSEVRLALLDAAALDRLAAGFSAADQLGLRYWDGAGWSDREEEAAALFTPGAYGELSVRWVPQAQRYALLLATGPGDPAGAAIMLRWAEQPWGPWTTPLQLLDWVAVGMSVDPFTRFIKASADDPVGESIFAAQARGTGAAYAPYLFDARRDGDQLVLRYTLSTWNPYQVVLMEHRLVAGEF